MRPPFPPTDPARQAKDRRQSFMRQTDNAKADPGGRARSKRNSRGSGLSGRVRRLIGGALLCAALPLAAQPYAIQQKLVEGVLLRVPAGWTVSSQRPDAHSTVLRVQADPARPDAAAAGLAAYRVAPARAAAMTPKSLAEQQLAQLIGTSRTRATLLAETPRPGAVFQLYRLDDGTQRANLSAYASVDAGTGMLLHLFYFAPEKEFAANGGPAAPLVFFAGLNPGVLGRLQADAAGAGTGSPADPQRLHDLQTRIIEMNNRARQKIVYSTGAGWCYQGDAGCR